MAHHWRWLQRFSTFNRQYTAHRKETTYWQTPKGNDTCLHVLSANRTSKGQGSHWITTESFKNSNYMYVTHHHSLAIESIPFYPCSTGTVNGECPGLRARHTRIRCPCPYKVSRRRSVRRTPTTLMVSRSSLSVVHEQWPNVRAAIYMETYTSTKGCHDLVCRLPTFRRSPQITYFIRANVHARA